MGGGSVYLSIHPRRYIVPKGPLRASKRASTSFLAGKFFFFFSWIAWGNLQQQQKKSVLVLFISFFGGGVFGTAAAAGPSFSPGRASLEEGRWKRGKRREKGNIRYISHRSSFVLGRREEKRREKREGERTFREVGRKSIGFFVFIYLYIYILFSCI